MATTTTYNFTTEDIEYLRRGDKALLVRLYRPEGSGPFPAMVELHGGAWNNGDRTLEKNRHEALVKTGVVVAAFDFRQGSEGAYPAMMADVNYGVRWLKAHARELKTRPDLVGISGQSSGGHVAMLAAMRPHDPRYAATPLPSGSQEVDASVRCVVMSWPVINPLGRYRHAKRVQATQSWAADIVASHDRFWGSEANMSEASPTLALERGEKVALPPALWLQTPGDQHHDYHDEDASTKLTEAPRFEALYRKAGGDITLQYFDAPQRFTSTAPTSPEAIRAFEMIAAFVHKHIPVER